MIRALHTATLTRGAKKARKKTAGGGGASTQVTLVNGRPPNYPASTQGVDKSKFPIGPLVPATGNQKPFRIWTNAQRKSGDSRFQISKTVLKKMRRVALDPSNNWKLPSWAEGKPGINTSAKQKAQQSSASHGGGGQWHTGGGGNSPRACTDTPPH